MATHRLSNTRLYRIYGRMMNRCYDETADNFKYYGGRGIGVCDEWRNDKTEFFKWALANGYRDDLTIDRIDCNRNYEPSNCRWISQKEQMRNTRSTIIVLIDGKEYSLHELSAITGVSRDALYLRVHLGKPVLHMDEIIRYGFRSIKCNR